VPVEVQERKVRVDALLVLLLIVIALAVGAAVAAPFLRPEPEAGIVHGERLAELEARKEAKYREIRDAELDYRTGKLSKEDHRALDRSLRREAIAILEEIDRATAPGAEPDRRS
jgi:hypothetical protein